VGGAGEWEALETGRRWRVVARERDQRREGPREIPARQGGKAVDPERPPKSVVIGTIFGSVLGQGVKA
jgi:hypothetical protein